REPDTLPGDGPTISKAITPLPLPASTDKPPERDQTQGEDGNKAEADAAAAAANPESGNVNAVAGAEDLPAAPASRETVSQIRARVWGRFVREGRDLSTMGVVRDDMNGTAKEAMPDKDERMIWVYSE